MVTPVPVSPARIARWIGAAQADPQGAVIVGADLLGREIGRALQEQGFDVLLVDTNVAHTTAARTSGLPTFQGSVLSHRFAEEATLDGIGNLLALTTSDEVNLLAVEQFVPTFGRPHLYRAAAADPKRRQPAHPGRALFGADLDVDTLRSKLESGGRIRATRLTEKFDADDYGERYGQRAHPLFVVHADGRLQIVTAGGAPTFKAGQTVLALIEADDPARAAANPQPEPT